MPSLSVAIVACNEVDRLAGTLSSIGWADEIVWIDSGLTDGTVELAQSLGAKVYSEAWRGYGGQVNAALDRCTKEWVLNLDADEAASQELAQEIRALLTVDPAFEAYLIPRSNQIFGRWMRHGGLYPDKKLRLFKKGIARLREDTEPHATPKTASRTGSLKGEILHYQYLTLAEYVDHMNRYSTASVPLLQRRGKTSAATFGFEWNAVLNPLGTFLYNYILRLGFLDGREGLLFHLNHALYVNWKYVKAWKGEGKVEVVERTPKDPRPFFE